MCTLSLLQYIRHELTSNCKWNSSALKPVTSTLRTLCHDRLELHASIWSANFAKQPMANVVMNDQHADQTLELVWQVKSCAVFTTVKGLTVMSISRHVISHNVHYNYMSIKAHCPANMLLN